jgi:hypothetical protein
MFLKIITCILQVLVFTTMAQTKNDYIKNWKKVEDLEKIGLTKSASAEVTAIYKLAQKDNNDAQQIKACMYFEYFLCGHLN